MHPSGKFSVCFCLKIFFIICTRRENEGSFVEENTVANDTCFPCEDTILNNYYKKYVHNYIILEIITVANLNNSLYNFQYVFHDVNLRPG